MAAKKTILLVDDDEDLREALAEQFELHDSFETLQAANANQGIDQATTQRIDLILLDVDMPDMDGREACKIMRQKGVRAPVIMLTGQDGDADTILGLEFGANDYVTKPFKFSVLLARVRAHLRSFEQSEDATFKIGPYEFLSGDETSGHERRQEDPPDGEGNEHPEISLPRGRQAGGAGRVVGGSLGL